MGPVAMNLCLLHLDNALRAQPEFMAVCGEVDATDLDLQHEGGLVRLWADTSRLGDVRRCLRNERGERHRGPSITWMGSGDFHHVTALLVERAAESLAEPPTVVHFDNHPDWVAHADGMHCGSWVRSLLDRNVVERVITIGVNSRDVIWPDVKGAGLDHVESGRHVIFAHRDMRLSPFHSRVHRSDYYSNLDRWREGAPSLSELMTVVSKMIETRSIYITIDKDVLRECDATTNWDQGILDVETLEGWLAFLIDHHHLAGMDVIGDYSPALFAGPLRSRILKRAEVLVDQPIWPSGGTACNERSNIRLLATLRSSLC